MSSAITRVLYKNLLRTAREYDVRPWNRAWLVASPPMRPLVKSLEFYLSHKPCVDLVKHNFRHPPPNMSKRKLNALALTALQQMTLHSYDAAMRIQDKPTHYTLLDEEKNVFHRSNSMLDEVADEDENKAANEDDEHDDDVDVEDDADVEDNVVSDSAKSSDSIPSTEVDKPKPAYLSTLPSFKQLNREVQMLSSEEIEEAIMANLTDDHPPTASMGPSLSNTPLLNHEIHHIINQVKEYRSKRLAEGVTAASKKEVAERDNLDDMDHLIESEDLAFDNTLQYNREVDHVTLLLSNKEQQISPDQIHPFSKPEIVQILRHIRNIEVASSRLVEPDSVTIKEADAEEALPVEEALHFFLPNFTPRTDHYHILSTKLSRSRYIQCLNNLHFHVLLDHCVRSQSYRGSILLFIAMKERGFKLTRTMIIRLLIRCRDAGRPFEAMAVLRDSQFGNIMKLATNVVTPPLEQDITESYISQNLPVQSHTLESLFPTAHNLLPTKHADLPFIDEARAISMVPAERDRLRRDGPLLEIVIQTFWNSKYSDDIRNRIEDAMYDEFDQYPLQGPHWNSVKKGAPHLAVDHFDLMRHYQIPFTRVSTVRALIQVAACIHDTPMAMSIFLKAVNDGLTLDLGCLDDLVDIAIFHQHTHLVLDALSLADQLKIKVANDFYAKCLLHAMTASDPIKYDLIRSWAQRAGIEVELSVNGDSSKVPDNLSSPLVSLLLTHAEDRGFENAAVQRRLVHLIVSEFVEDMKQNLRDMSTDNWIVDSDDADFGPYSAPDDVDDDDDDDDDNSH